MDASMPVLAELPAPGDALEQAPAGRLDRGWVAVAAGRVAAAVAEQDAGSLERLAAQLAERDRERVSLLGLGAQDDSFRAALLALAETVAYARDAMAAREVAVEDGGPLADLLRRLRDEPGCGSTDLGEELCRVASTAVRLGLATPYRYGRSNAWYLTARGERAVATLEAS